MSEQHTIDHLARLMTGFRDEIVLHAMEAWAHERSMPSLKTAVRDYRRLTTGDKE